MRGPGASCCYGLVVAKELPVVFEMTPGAALVGGLGPCFPRKEPLISLVVPGRVLSRPGRVSIRLVVADVRSFLVLAVSNEVLAHSVGRGGGAGDGRAHRELVCVWPSYCVHVHTWGRGPDKALGGGPWQQPCCPPAIQARRQKKRLQLEVRRLRRPIFRFDRSATPPPVSSAPEDGG